MLIIYFYVYDLIYLGKDSVVFEKFKKFMMVEFEISDLGIMHYFLGIALE